MKKSTVRKLNKLNRDFYDTVAKDFDDSRSYAWHGWSKLLSEHIDLQHIHSVLDIGCGNARFLDFLLEQGFSGIYTGIEPDCYLAKKAQTRLSSLAQNQNLDNATIIKCNYEKYIKKSSDSGVTNISTTDRASDSPSKPANPDKYDLIVAFGLLHHIAGEQNRVEFFENFMKLLSSSPSATLVVTAWQFAKDPRYHEKFIKPDAIATQDMPIKPDALTHLDALKKPHQLNNSHQINKPDQLNKPHQLNKSLNLEIDPTDLDQGDYFLPWSRGAQAIRYCHDFSLNEEARLIEKLKATYPGLEAKSFEADGKSGVLNRYIVLKNRIQNRFSALKRPD